MIWIWLNTPSWIWWALYAAAWTTWAIVHLWRIRSLDWYAPAHLWLEAIGLALFSLGAILGGMAVGRSPLLVGTSAYVRTLWVMGSFFLIGGGISDLYRQWRMKP